ncbi:MAG TPA: hypothetical protein VF118_06015 [Gemmatimonadaceae bacterium]
MTSSCGVALLAAGCLALSACFPSNSAYLAQAPGLSAQADTNAPVNQRRLPGVVEYDNEGLNGQLAKRRADAYKKMTQACHGPYKIENEGPVLLYGGRDASPTWVIHFTCVGADSTASPQH